MSKENKIEKLNQRIAQPEEKDDTINKILSLSPFSPYDDEIKERQQAIDEFSEKFGDYMGMLDFENPDNFNKTVKILEALRIFYGDLINSDNYKDNYKDRKIVRCIEENLKDILKEKKGSYLLNKRMEGIYKQRDLDDGALCKGEFKISPKYNASIFESTKIGIRPIEVPEEEYDGDYTLITPEHIAIKRVDKKSKSEKELQDLLDYQYLIGYLRGDIQNDFGLDLAEMSLIQQNYFLQFIKSKKIEQIEPAMNFMKKFGINGAKAFLSCEYGEENGEKIIEMAEKLDEIKSKEIFSEYSQVADMAEKLKKGLDESLAIKETDLPEDVKNDFPAQVYEGILRRAKDLLIASYPILVEKKKADFGINDITIALNGLGKFLEIAKELSSKDSEYKINFIKNRIRENTEQFFYKITDKENKDYGLIIFIRPEEDEKGQARIGFELDFDTKNPNKEFKNAFSQEILYKNKNENKKISRLRVAIDRETINDEEKISLDTGRDKRDDKDIRRTGDVMGKVLSFVSQTGHHNPDSFDPKFAQKEIFKKIAETFKQYLALRFAK